MSDPSTKQARVSIFELARGIETEIRNLDQAPSLDTLEKALKMIISVMPVKIKLSRRGNADQILDVKIRSGLGGEGTHSITVEDGHYVDHYVSSHDMLKSNHNNWRTEQLAWKLTYLFAPRHWRSAEERSRHEGRDPTRIRFGYVGEAARRENIWIFPARPSGE